MSNVVAIRVDGQWMPAQQADQNRVAKVDAHTVDATMSEVDQIVAHLGAVARLAQGLSATDAQRVREFVYATSAVLSATTRLPGSDQAKFEQALRMK